MLCPPIYSHNTSVTSGEYQKYYENMYKDR